jgi:SAM-dependent methyltransferase
MASQFVSRERVEKHGQVFTDEREVTAMVDLVGQEAQRIDSRFLEPACGTGNFLAEVLERKLAVAGKRYSRIQSDYERYSILAVASIYGIDILEDSIEQCRERLYAIFHDRYSALFGARIQDRCLRTAWFILSLNITRGDALSLKTMGGNPGPIIFPEWSPLNGKYLKRRDFSFQDLLNHESNKELPLFSDLGDDVFIPTPIREYPPVHFLELADAD